jgi:hypothetical protein
MLFFQVCHFLRTPKWQSQQNTLALNTTLLNNHMCHNLIPSSR